MKRLTVGGGVGGGGGFWVFFFYCCFFIGCVGWLCGWGAGLVWGLGFVCGFCFFVLPSVQCGVKDIKNVTEDFFHGSTIVDQLTHVLIGSFRRKWESIKSDPEQGESGLVPKNFPEALKPLATNVGQDRPA